MDFDEFLQYRALNMKAHLSHENSDEMLEYLLDQNPEASRQMCAKVSPALYERLEEVCMFLDISKRSFIERAVLDALIKAENLLKSHGIYDLADPTTNQEGA